MNKNDLKNSLNSISPDPYLESRLEAKVRSFAAAGKKQKKLSFSTAVLCGLVVALSVSAGLGLTHFSDNEIEADLSAHRTPETASVDAFRTSSDILNSQKENTGNRENNVAYSVPTIETNVHTKQVLSVNGKDIAPENYVKFYKNKNYALLPFTAVLKEFGAVTKWENEVSAVISLNGKTYKLDTEKCILTADGNSENLLDANSHGSKVPNDIPMYKTANGEFIVDNYTLQSALDSLGFDCTVTVDYDTETAVIK